MRGGGIFGSKWADAAWLYAPGVIALALAALIPQSPDSAFYIVFAFVALSSLDSGHVYATLWRTYLNPQERKRSSIYLWMPIAIFVLFFVWLRWEWPYLGAFIVYATLFHNVRQFFGISKWYQRLNGRFSRDSDRLLYTLCGLPVFIAHFRSDLEWNSYYTEKDVFIWPNPAFESLSLKIYLTVVVLWIAFEIHSYWNYRDLSRTLSVFLPALLYGCCFLLGRNMVQILFPLVVSHGLAYIGLVALSVHRLSDRKRQFAQTVGWVLATAVVLGAAEHFAEGELSFTDPRQAFWTALILVPLFCHYVFDAFLWKKTHPEAELLFK